MPDNQNQNQNDPGYLKSVILVKDKKIKSLSDEVNKLRQQLDTKLQEKIDLKKEMELERRIYHRTLKELIKDE